MVTVPDDFPKHEIIPPIHLTAKEIMICRHELSDILIAPFDESKCKGVGYNISPSELCYSVRKKRMLQVHRTAQEVFVWIPPHDTILTLSHEYLQVSSHIAGCFLSRLRPVTKGLGNVSTTLDPCWKGMLLLSINNPSSRRIKLVISQLIDDQFSPTAIITMLLWKISSSNDDGEGILTFRLDNPAMRADIWSELIAEPYRFFRGNHYRKFRNLIESLLSYQPSVDQRSWITELQEKLEELENAVRAVPRRFNDIRALLLRIHHLECEAMPPELIKKLRMLYNSFNSSANYESVDSFDSFNSSVENIICSLSEENSENNKKNTNIFTKSIYSVYQECSYQNLCCQVNEIHDIIRNKVKYRWERDIFKNIWFSYIRPHFIALLTTIALIFALFYIDKLESQDLYTKLIIGISPALVSYLFEWISKKIFGT